jgi:3-methyladenine DNA glycosylase AlkD
MDAEAVVAAIREGLEAAATPERAVNEKRYLKSDLEFIGTTVPATKVAVRAALKPYGNLDRESVVALATEAWQHPVHELRMAAVMVLARNVKELEPGDLPFVERMIRESKTWAFVDELAAHVVGAMAVRHPALNAELDRWAVDEDFWVRRSALLSLLVPLRQGGGDWERFARYADAMLAEKEFFIRKAIGWILRDTSRKRPALVTAWIEPRAGRASGVTIREAVRRLPAEDAERIMANYRAR